MHPPILKLIELDDFTAFCFWIIGQHISGKVADVMISKLKEELGTLSPEKILQIPIDRLRNIGLSKPKSRYLHNLAEFFLTTSGYNKDEMSSQELIEFFSQIKGIGEWTVQMHLIFAYGRMDIFAPKDLVVRKGLAKIYDLPQVPNERDARVIGNRWGELATIGTILCWAVMGE